MDEHEDDQLPIKSPIKRYGSTRKIYLFNSEYQQHQQTSLFLPTRSGLGDKLGKGKGKGFNWGTYSDVRSPHFMLIDDAALLTYPLSLNSKNIYRTGCEYQFTVFGAKVLHDGCPKPLPTPKTTHEIKTFIARRLVNCVA